MRLLAEPIDTSPRLPSWNKPRVQELRKPQQPKKLLDQERACPDEGAPTLLSNVQYRDKKPATVHIVISRLGDNVWYLGTSLFDAEQAVVWYKKRFWIEEMFRDLTRTRAVLET